MSVHSILHLYIAQITFEPLSLLHVASVKQESRKTLYAYYITVTTNDACRTHATSHAMAMSRSMETRARKKRRIRRESIPRTTTNTNLYFDVVPHDVLFHLVKHLSKWPHSEQWLDTVDGDDVLTVLRTEGALSNVSRSMFYSLGNQLWSSRVFGTEKFEIVAEILAPHLESLSFSVSASGAFKSYEFSSLRSLQVGMFGVTMRMFRDVLTACGSSLVELTCQPGSLRKADVRNIAFHCKSLRVLKLCELTYKNISLKMIWEELGDKLTKFSGRIALNDFPLIAHHCTALRELKIVNSGEVIDENKQMVIESVQALQSLCVLGMESFGHVNDLEFLTVEELEALIQGRPSDFLLEFEGSFNSQEKFHDVMRSIGSRLRVFSYLFVFNPIPGGTTFMLDNIQELRLEYDYRHDDLKLERLFTHPMPNLRKLAISVKNTSIFSNIARCTSNLLELTCALPDSYGEILYFLSVSASDITQLLQENEKLHHLDIDFGFTQTYPSDDMILLISCLNVSEAIMHVVIRYYTESETDSGRDPDSHTLNEFTRKEPGINSEKCKKLRNACVPLRTKRIGLQFKRYSY